MGRRHDGAAGGELRVAVHLGDVEHGGDAGVGRSEELDPLVSVPGGEGGGEGGADGGLGVVVQLARGQGGTPQGPAQVGEELRLDGPHRHPSAVPGPVGAVAGVAAGEDVVSRPGRRAQGQLLVDGQRHEPEHAVGHGDIEVGAVSRGGPSGQGGGDGQRGLHAPGGGVGDGGSRDRRRPFGPRRAHAQVPADGQVVEVVAGPLRPWPLLAVPAGRAVDDPGVPGLDHVVADAQPVDHPGPEALDDDVGPVGQGQEGLPPAVVLEVDQDAAHAAVAAVGEEPRVGRSHVRLGHGAHLDDQRAIVGQQARAARRRADRREVEDGDPGQKAGAAGAAGG